MKNIALVGLVVLVASCGSAAHPTPAVQGGNVTDTGEPPPAQQGNVPTPTQQPNATAPVVDDDPPSAPDQYGFSYTRKQPIMSAQYHAGVVVDQNSTCATEICALNPNMEITLAYDASAADYSIGQQDNGYSSAADQGHLMFSPVVSAGSCTDAAASEDLTVSPHSFTGLLLVAVPAQSCNNQTECSCIYQLAADTWSTL